MAKINTRAGLIKFIRSRLGEPIIRVELTDEQIDYIIDDVISHFSEFAYDGQEEKHMLVPIFNSVKEYKLDSRVTSLISLRVKRNNSMTNIMSTFGIPSGYSVTSSNVGSQLKLSSYETTLASISKFEYLFDVHPNYSFNGNSKVLTFHENMDSYDSALLEVALEYEPEEVDMIYNNPWIKDMCVAESKIQWGTNVGKYSGSLINGNTINWSEIKSDGQTDKERLNEELLTRWSPPLGVVVG